MKMKHNSIKRVFISNNCGSSQIVGCICSGSGPMKALGFRKTRDAYHHDPTNPSRGADLVLLA